MAQPRVFGPFDSAVPAQMNARTVYRATGSGYTVTLPKLNIANDGDRVSVQRWSRDTGAQPITFAAAPGDSLSDDRTSFDLVNAGDAYVLEASSLSGVRSWAIVDMQTSSRAGTGGPSGPDANTLGTPSNPVTSASAARPTGLTVVYWITPTQPANWVSGDVWTQV